MFISMNIGKGHWPHVPHLSLRHYYYQLIYIQFNYKILYVQSRVIGNGISSYMHILFIYISYLFIIVAVHIL